MKIRKGIAGVAIAILPAAGVGIALVTASSASASPSTACTTADDNLFLALEHEGEIIQEIRDIGLSYWFSPYALARYEYLMRQLGYAENAVAADRIAKYLACSDHTQSPTPTGGGGGSPS